MQPQQRWPTIALALMSNEFRKRGATNGVARLAAKEARCVCVVYVCLRVYVYVCVLWCS